MEVLTQMVVLLLIMAAGYVAHRCNLMGGDFDKRLSAFVIDMSCPALIVSSVFGDTLPDRQLIAPLLGVGFLTYVVLFVLAISVPRLFEKDNERLGMMGFMVMFANVGFLGYPVVQSIFGHEAVFYAALLNVPNTLFVFVIGTPFIKGGAISLKSFDWHLLFTPGMVASYIAMIVVIFGITDVPTIITRPITLIGSMTVPAALLIIGSSMADIDMKSAFGQVKIYLISFVRLILAPAVVFGFFTLLSRFVEIDPLVIKVNMVVIGMPVASYGTMFCLRYGRDESFMVQATLLTTLASAITIPIMAGLLF